MKPTKIKTQIAIIGGGIGGLLAALELADAGYSVIIIERKEYFAEGTSNGTPGRMGQGFHYIHKETAKKCLLETINFVKKFDSKIHLTIGDGQEENHFLKRGRYFITKDSLFDKEKILETYKFIQEEYRKLCEIDPANQVFGDPDNLFRILDVSEYENDVDMGKVACGIETAEHLLNWPKFREYLIEQVEQNKNIRKVVNCEIKKISYEPETQAHVLFGVDKDGTSNYQIEANFVVNATWEYVQEITRRAGLIIDVPESQKRTNRLKILAEVLLPETLKNRNSMFFCMGAHCMFSNMGDGQGYLTYAPVTNFMKSTAITVPRDMVRYLNANDDPLQEDECRETDEITKNSKKYGEEIIKGVAQYIPEMSKAQLRNVKFGVVITKGDVNIFDHSSSFHKRNYSGLESGNFPLGWINNSSMKLLFAYGNAVELVKIAEEHFSKKASILGLVSQILACCSAEQDVSSTYKLKALEYVLARYFTANELPGISNSSDVPLEAILPETDSNITEMSSSSSSSSSSNPNCRKNSSAEGQSIYFERSKQIMVSAILAKTSVINEINEKNKSLFANNDAEVSSSFMGSI